MHPVAQDLTVHAVGRCRLATRPTLQHKGYAKQSPHLATILGLAGKPAQVRRGMFLTRDLDRLAHLANPSPSFQGRSESSSADLGIDAVSRGFRYLV